jgi:ergothioneine biosynthesis protein EgtB
MHITPSRLGHPQPDPCPRATEYLTAAGLAKRYDEVRSTTLSLAAGLTEEDCVVQSMPDASPVKWHLAHTTWFFETFILERFEPDFQPFHPSFRVLFNSYYNGVGDKHPRPERGLVTRPGLAEIHAYRKQVDQRIQGFLDGAQPEPDALALLELGLHHEQQHQELILTDVKHLLSRNPLRPAYHPSWPLTQVAEREQGWIGFAGGLVQIGHAAAAGFAYDNETPRHQVFLRPYELAAYPVTYGEFLDFVEDGGYQQPEWWLSAGWDTVRQQGWQAPFYWEKIDGQWQTFTLHGMVRIDPDTPVCHISYFEADAFARWAAHALPEWRGARLPTEAEWECAAASQPESIGEGNFMESRVLHTLRPPEPQQAGRLMQLFGDVWEWTASSYSPYPGFAPAPGAVGEYNGKFMCNQYVLRGGSCATPRSHIRASYRNFFPADARWQFSGLRLARDAGV